MTTLHAGLDFHLPDELLAHEPAEARGLARDGVRLMVSRVIENTLTQTRFSQLPEFLTSGDVLVVNASATISAAVDAVREAHDGGTTDIALHFSTPLSKTRWVVELRTQSQKTNAPLLDAETGERIPLPAGGVATLIEPYRPVTIDATDERVRLWVAEVTLPEDALAYLAHYGLPIRYGYVSKEWPLAYYQTIFAKEPGSAEMPSAGRPFTHALVERLARAGVRVVPIVLHTGVSSLESDEAPYPERYRVPAATAKAVNDARSIGGRVIAVGTTVVRALETVASDDGHVTPGTGWTDLVITAERRLRVVDGMITGFHPPNASHLSMLEAFTGREHLSTAYEAALHNRYRWHEFGDVHLILR